MRRLENPADKDSTPIYELHGNCIANQVDTSAWEWPAEFKCIMSFEFCGAEGSDASVIKAVLEADKTKTPAWECNDAFAADSSNDPFTYVVDDDDTGVCLADEE